MDTTKRTIVADLLRLSIRLQEVGIDKDTAFLAAGRYLSGVGFWTKAITEGASDGRFSALAGAKAFNILDNWVIR
jgi:hypothetical protein